ncbi:MAG: anti-sigma factor [Ruegeria sp.]
MSEARAFTDEELTAFLDGEADDALHAEIEAALEADPAVADQMAALDVPLAPIAEAYEALLQDVPPMPALPEAVVAPDAVPQPKWGWGWGLGTFATGLAAGLAVAMFTGFGTPEPAPRGWVSFVASYQALYTEQTLMVASPSVDEAQMQLAAVSDAIGFDLTGLPEAEGLTFKRAQTLGFNGKPLIQIAFARADGTPVALCIIPAGPDAKPVDMGAAEGMELARWNTPGYGFLLIGGTDTAPLAREAETFEAWSTDVAI